MKNPELGAHLDPEDRANLKPENMDVQVVVTDGLSAEAVHHNIPEMLPVLEDGLKSRNYRLGRHILAPFGRVKLARDVGDVLRPDLVIMLIGERPGGNALASRSMSAYLAFNLKNKEEQQAAAEFSASDDIAYEYTLFTNIYAGGLPPVEAGSVVAEKAIQILTHRAAGNRLEDVLKNRTNRAG